MSDNFYEPPKADVDNSAAARQEFYVVSIPKFWVLFAATIGMYHLYWFYKHWAQYKSFHAVKMLPVMRGIFSIFFAHKLFRAVRGKTEGDPAAPAFRPDLLAATYIILSLLSSGAERLANKAIGGPYMALISLLPLPFVGWMLAHVQRAANVACGDVRGETNNGFSAANIFWVLLGSALWLSFIASLFYGDTAGPV